MRIELRRETRGGGLYKQRDIWIEAVDDGIGCTNKNTQ